MWSPASFTVHTPASAAVCPGAGRGGGGGGGGAGGGGGGRRPVRVGSQGGIGAQTGFCRA